MKSAFVTGATGFVGGHLCERLIRDGVRVTALVRSAFRAAALGKLGVRVVEASLHSADVFAKEAASAEVVFHLAAITKAVRLEEFEKVNVGGCRALGEGLRAGAFGGRVVYLSSLAAGGPVISGRPRREEDPDAPVSEYGRSKGRGEIALGELASPWGLTILRPGAIYGPREHEILELLKLLAQTGMAVRFGAGVVVQLTHVDDVVDAMIRAAEHPAAAARSYYLTERAPHTFDAIIGAAARALGKRGRIIGLPLGAASGLAGLFDVAGRLVGKPLSPLNRDKVNELRAGSWLADPSRLEDELGWRAAVPLEDGLPATIKWYKEHQWL